MVLLVVVNKDNAVHDINAYKTVEEQEKGFEDECLGYGIMPCDANYENGYIELECGTTICITSVETA